MGFLKKAFPAFGTGLGTLASSTVTLGLATSPKDSFLAKQEEVITEKPAIVVPDIVPDSSSGRRENEDIKSGSQHGIRAADSSGSERQSSEERSDNASRTSIENSDDKSSKEQASSEDEVSDKDVSEESSETEAEDEDESPQKSVTKRRLNKELEGAIKGVKNSVLEIWNLISR